jgi:hypothetical protein
MLGTAMLALANVLVYVLGVLPLGARVTATDERAQNAARDVVAATAQLAQARRTVEGRVRANDQLRRFYADVLPVDQSAAREVTILRLASSPAGAWDCRTFDRVGEDQRSRGSTAWTCGDHTEIRDFACGRNQPEFVIIRGCRCSRTNARERGPAVLRRVDLFREARGQ